MVRWTSPTSLHFLRCLQKKEFWSISLGVKIKELPPNVIFSSPQRCVDTGLRIIEGADWNSRGETFRNARTSGPFVIGKTNQEVNKLASFAQENDDWSFLHRHVAGEEASGMRNRIEGTNNFLNELYPSFDGYIFVYMS